MTPFGLTNAPSMFQNVMNELLQRYLRKFVLVFFDDILVYNASWEEHLGHVNLVLEVLEGGDWIANKKKCEFGKKKIAYLGHQISEAGVEMDGTKLRPW